MDVLAEAPKTRFAYMQADNHSDAITVVSLSRDGTCCATASLDGKVCIYSILSSPEEGEQGISPIHVFSPHDGAPVYGLIFINADHEDSDAHESTRATWSYLLTGASFNRELRIWSCTDWHCEQTVRFCAATPVAITSDTGVATFMPNAKPSIIMALDLTSSVLVASDITRRVLYILEITRDLSSPSATESRRTRMRFSSISEFLLTTPCILFALGELNRKALTDSDLSSLPSGKKQSMDLVSLEIHAIHTWSPNPDFKEPHDVTVECALEATSDLDELDIPPLRPSDFSQTSIHEPQCVPTESSPNADITAQVPDVERLSDLVPQGTFEHTTNNEVSRVELDHVPSLPEGDELHNSPGILSGESVPSSRLENEAQVTSPAGSHSARMDHSPGTPLTRCEQTRPDSPETCTNDDSVLSTKPIPEPMNDTQTSKL
ncbi:unnamed protein product [Echinostoma caproni]|uniref:Ge1_WD40 domain-containing protein n=1 Tax=Echinostoma caproni TaxID=27848 RepID=A0A183AMH7_9TREM|nr:unnamed protein product [Echinostoma caproni]